MRDTCNMPQRLDEWIRDNLSLDLDDCSLDDMEDLFCGSAEDIWKKFDIGIPADFPNYEEQCEIWGDAYSSSGEIRNHDCMWAGHCLSKEHDRTSSPPPPHIVQPIQMAKPPPIVNANSVLINSQQKLVTIQKSASLVKAQQTVKCERKYVSDSVPTSIITNNGRTGVIVQKTVGRSLLLNSRTNTHNNNNNNKNQHNNNSHTTTPTTNIFTTSIVKQEFVSPHRRSLESNGDSPRPETPQSLSGDDEFPIPIDHHNATSVFRNALDVMLSQTAVPDDWDEELLMNFGDVKKTKPATAATPVVQTPQSLLNLDLSRISASAQSDHNYDGSNKIKTEGLGVQTPSDSEEEEIDVVSLSERTTISRSSSTSSSGGSSSGLPTKPSPADQKQLQEITTTKLLSSASKAVSRKLKFAARRYVAANVNATTLTTHGKRKKTDSGTDDDSIEYTKVSRPNKRSKNFHGTRRKYRSRFSTDSEPDSREKRSLHNSMERMRRIDLRNSFEELRQLVPSLANKERAAKVVILRDAAVYCSDLGTQSRLMKNEVEALQREQMRLRAVVSSLRKAAAVRVNKRQHVHKNKKSFKSK